jgi:hypothetical protein
MMTMVSRLATIVTSISAQHTQHEQGFGLFLRIDVPDHLPELDQETCRRVEQLRHDEPAIQRRLNPAAGEDRGFRRAARRDGRL